VNLLGEGSAASKANLLYYLSRESMRRKQIDELWKTERAKSLAAVLTRSRVAEAIRQELRRQTGQRVEPDEIVTLPRETVVRPECLD
jgi:hypothetical protein